MKPGFIVAAILLLFGSLNAQTKVYRGNSTSYSDCLVTVDGILKYSFVAVLIGPY